MEVEAGEKGVQRGCVDEDQHEETVFLDLGFLVIEKTTLI